jgi:hypothetical protein
MAQLDYIPPIPRYPTIHFPWPAGDDGCGPAQTIQFEKEQNEREYPDNICIQTERLASGNDLPISQAPRKIAMQLLHDSWIIFKEIKLEDWVKYAMGMPSLAIALFESHHKEMGLSLFSLLQQYPCVFEIFREATKVVGVTLSITAKFMAHH